MLLISILALGIIFAANLTIGMYYGFDVRHYWFFEMLHFLGGFFMAMFFSSFFQSVVLILAGLAAVTFLWELAEFLIAKIPAASEYVERKFRLNSVDFEWKDTVLDIFLNFSGAVLFIYFLK